MPVNENAADTSNTKYDSSFFGHPKGLAYLAFTELWERFSYYGMNALLMLYMVQELLLPGHIENVGGIYVLQNMFNWLFGALSDQAFASMIMGLYGGLVYVTPIIGGWLADRFVGAKRMVLLGVLLMTAGHFAMVFEQSFLLALLLLIIGSGALKGNIAAQVGQLYSANDESRRNHAYTIFSVCINIGAVLGVFICGLLAQLYGWHYGFGSAGLFMLLACAFYIKGTKHFSDERPKGKKRIKSEPLTKNEWIVLALLVPIFLINISGHAAYFQSFNVSVLWISEHVNLDTPFGTIPTSWFLTLDALAGIISAPLLILLWKAQNKRGKEPSDLNKIALGLLFLASSMIFYAIGGHLAADDKTSFIWPMLAQFSLGVGFILYWPTTLSFISRSAPKSITAMMLGTIYVSLFFGSVFSGYIAGFYEELGPAKFFVLNAAIPVCGAVLLFALSSKLGRAFKVSLQLD